FYASAQVRIVAAHFFQVGLPLLDRAPQGGIKESLFALAPLVHKGRFKNILPQQGTRARAGLGRGVIETKGQLCLQYLAQSWLARAVRRLSMALALVSFHQQPESLRRS